jgi:hypothetical protein
LILVTSDFDPEFKKKMRRLITERLALEAVNGGSWKAALEGLKDLFEIDQAELERDIASLIEIRSWDKETKDHGNEAPIDLNAQRIQRHQIDGPQKRAKPSSPAPKGGSYGSGVRAQVFEVVVRQGIAGAPWRSICAGPMMVNNIDPDEVQAEVDRRKKMMGHDPKKMDNDPEDEDPPQSGRGGGGRPKAPVPKNPFPFIGGATRALPLPRKKKGEAKDSHDIKSHDMKSQDQSSSPRPGSESEDEPED